MNKKIDQNAIIFIAFAVYTAANFIFYPYLWFVQIFTLAFLVLIYKKFNETPKKMLYYSTLLLAVIGVSLSLPLGERFAVYYFYIPLFIYIVLTAVEIIRKRRLGEALKSWKNPYGIFLLIFAIYIIASFFIAGNKKLAAKSIFNYMIMFSLLLMVFLENRHKDEMKKTFSLMGWIYAGIIAFGTLEVMGIRVGTRNHYSELDIFATDVPFIKHVPVTFFYNPNNFAVFLVLGMVVLFTMIAFTKDKKKKYMYLGFYLVSQINLIFTTSRTAWITLIMTILFAIVFGYIHKNRMLTKSMWKIGTLTVAIFVVLSVVPFMSPYYGKMYSIPYIGNIFHISTPQAPVAPPAPSIEIGEKGSVNERYTLMHDIVQGVVKEGNYFGFGAGNISKYIQSLDNTFGITDPHNLWFEILGDFGIPIVLYLIITYIMLLLSLNKRYIKYGDSMKPYITALGTAAFAFIFLAFAPSSVVNYTPFYILMGLCSAAVLGKQKVS